ncbi:uncharacterized protein LOC144421960 isoform X2 [Styela clava]
MGKKSKAAKIKPANQDIVQSKTTRYENDDDKIKKKTKKPRRSEDSKSTMSSTTCIYICSALMAILAIILFCIFQYLPPSYPHSTPQYRVVLNDHTERHKSTVDDDKHEANKITRLLDEEAQANEKESKDVQTKESLKDKRQSTLRKEEVVEDVTYESTDQLVKDSAVSDSFTSEQSMIDDNTVMDNTYSDLIDNDITVDDEDSFHEITESKKQTDDDSEEVNRLHTLVYPTETKSSPNLNSVDFLLEGNDQSDKKQHDDVADMQNGNSNEVVEMPDKSDFENSEIQNLNINALPNETEDTGESEKLLDNLDVKGTTSEEEPDVESEIPNVGKGDAEKAIDFDRSLDIEKTKSDSDHSTKTIGLDDLEIEDKTIEFPSKESIGSQNEDQNLNSIEEVDIDSMKPDATSSAEINDSDVSPVNDKNDDLPHLKSDRASIEYKSLKAEGELDIESIEMRDDSSSDIDDSAVSSVNDNDTPPERSQLEDENLNSIVEELEVKTGKSNTVSNAKKVEVDFPRENDKPDDIPLQESDCSRTEHEDLNSFVNSDIKTVKLDSVSNTKADELDSPVNDRENDLILDGSEIKDKTLETMHELNIEPTNLDGVSNAGDDDNTDTKQDDASKIEIGENKGDEFMLNSDSEIQKNIEMKEKIVTDNENAVSPQPTVEENIITNKNFKIDSAENEFSDEIFKYLGKDEEELEKELEESFYHEEDEEDLDEEIKVEQNSKLEVAEKQLQNQEYLDSNAFEKSIKPYHVDESFVVKDSQNEEEGYIFVSPGVTKKVIKKGRGKNIVIGDVVTIHCVGYLDTNPPKKFWSTKDAAQKPFTFAVGKRQVIKGWDEGARSMRLWEFSRIKIEAKKAYGKYGFEAWGLE